MCRATPIITILNNNTKPNHKHNHTHNNIDNNMIKQ